MEVEETHLKRTRKRDSLVLINQQSSLPALSYRVGPLWRGFANIAENSSCYHFARSNYYLFYSKHEYAMCAFSMNVGKKCTIKCKFSVNLFGVLPMINSRLAC